MDLQENIYTHVVGSLDFLIDVFLEVQNKRYSLILYLIDYIAYGLHLCHKMQIFKEMPARSKPQNSPHPCRGAERDWVKVRICELWMFRRDPPLPPAPPGSYHEKHFCLSTQFEYILFTTKEPKGTPKKNPNQTKVLNHTKFSRLD